MNIKQVKQEAKENNFLGYAMRCNCSVRAYNMIKRFRICEDVVLSNCINNYAGIGKRLLNEIETLQNNYNNQIK